MHAGMLQAATNPPPPGSMSSYLDLRFMTQPYEVDSVLTPAVMIKLGFTPRVQVAVTEVTDRTGANLIAELCRQLYAPAVVPVLEGLRRYYDDEKSWLAALRHADADDRCLQQRPRFKHYMD